MWGVSLKKEFLQKGIREHLLCSDCEQRIGKYEKYFCRVWYEKPLVPAHFAERLNWVSGLDYAKFKLFHLSVLWRMSVSSLDEFKAASLGSHSERIRQMLLTDNAGTQNDYSLWASAIVDDGNNLLHIVAPPRLSRYEGQRVCYSAYAGCQWHFFVSNDSSRFLKGCCLKTDGTLPLVSFPFRETNSVKLLLESAGKQG